MNNVILLDALSRDEEELDGSVDPQLGEVWSAFLYQCCGTFQTIIAAIVLFAYYIGARAKCGHMMSTDDGKRSKTV